MNKLNKEISIFDYKIDDTIKIFGVTVRIVNRLCNNEEPPYKKDDKMYLIYVKCLDIVCKVKEKTLNKHGEMM